MMKSVRNCRNTARFVIWCGLENVCGRWRVCGRAAGQGDHHTVLYKGSGRSVAGLWVLQNSYALLVGILIGFLDALPFIGTGTILLPWAALELFRGDFFHAAAYLTFFLITNSTRDFLEPRLLGEKLGVYPIVIAVVVYVGICIFGPAGVLLGPLMLLVIREVIREWLEA